MSESGGFSWSREFGLMSTCLRLGDFGGDNFGHLKNGLYLPRVHICSNKII